MAQIASHPPVQSVTHQLAALRTRLRGWLIVDGLSRVLLLVALLCLADLVLDRTLWHFGIRLDVAQRGILLALMVGATGWLVWKRLISPLLHTPSDDALCLSVEEKHRELGQSLISALQLSRQHDYASRGYSEELVLATIASGDRAAAGMKFADVLDGSRFRVNAMLLLIGLAVLAVGIWSVAATSAGATWFNRNILLGDASWPQQTYLIVHRVENGKLVLPRGDDWTQLVEVTAESEVLPEKILVEFRPTRGRPPQLMKPAPGQERMFRTVFRNVIEPFRFRVRGGDAVTPWYEVELVDQPEIASLTLTLTPPAYTGLPAELLPPEKGPYYVLPGSKLAISGTSTKPLASGELKQEEQVWPLAIENETSFSAALPSLAEGRYEITLTDQEQLSSRRPTPLTIHLKPDRAPQLAASLQGVGGMIVSRARVPYRVEIRDDFAVTGVALEYQARTAEQEADPETEEISLNQEAGELPAAELEFEHTWELEPLKLEPGTSLTFKFAAADNDTVSGPKTGPSGELLLRVVTEEELRADLLRREKEQRQDFQRLMKTQDDLLLEARALAVETEQSAELTGDQKQAIMALQRRQKLLGDNLLGVAARFEQIIAEVKNNRLEEDRGPLQERLGKRIIQPLRSLAMDEVPAAVAHIDRGRRLQDNLAERNKALEETAAQQELILEQMQEILIHLVKTEGYQAAVNLLYEIEKTQKDVYNLTLRELQERIRRLLEEK